MEGDDDNNDEGDADDGNMNEHEQELGITSFPHFLSPLSPCPLLSLLLPLTITTTK